MRLYVRSPTVPLHSIRRSRVIGLPESAKCHGCHRSQGSGGEHSKQVVPCEKQEIRLLSQISCCILCGREWPRRVTTMVLIRTAARHFGEIFVVVTPCQRRKLNFAARVTGHTVRRIEWNICKPSVVSRDMAQSVISILTSCQCLYKSPLMKVHKLPVKQALSGTPNFDKHFHKNYFRKYTAWKKN